VHLAASNPKVQRLRRLTGRRSARYEEGLCVIEGPVLVRDAIAADAAVIEIFVREDRIDDVTDVDASVYVLSSSVFDSVSDARTPQGVMAVCELPIASQPEWTRDTWAVIADGVSDPGNLGTIIRSAEASGATAVIVINNSVDPFSPKTIRSSAGAVFHIPVIEGVSYENLQKAGMRLVGTTSHDDTDVHPQSLYELNCDGCLGIVLGNESRGLSIDTPVEEWVTIEHVGRSESLNVAMAASIIAMHVAHERSLKTSTHSDGAKG
jgi:RNA methyltransferase, TrmH family